MGIAEKEQAEKAQRGFWWHGQNLKKEDNTRHLLHGRCWLHHRRTNTELGWEWAVPTSHIHAYVRFGGHNQFQCSLGCLLFALWFHIDGVPFLRRWKLTSGYHTYEIGWTFFQWSLNWRIFTDPDEWHSKTPKWRDGFFDLPDFFLGKNTYKKGEQAPIDAIVPMPEGDYPVKVIFFTQEWERPRWPFPRVRQGATVDTENGIPIPGKGENAWDCDDSAFMSIGTSATTVEEAIASAVKSVNERRERYGGKNWMPEKRA